jgi:beta-lactamase regulating signal transducer with metallopeptidase domain
MYPLVSALLNGFILAATLTATVWLTLYLAPRRTVNAATRYVIWWVVLGAAIFVPLSFLPLSFLPSSPRSEITQVHQAEPAAAFPVRIAPPLPASAPTPIAIHVDKPATPWPRWPVLLWPLLSAILLIRLAASYFQLNHLKARAERIEAPQIDRWLERCRGVRPGISLAISPEIATPIATGPNSPTILIPARLFDELTSEDLDRIGLHETAHLVRRDDYALLLQRIIEAVFIASPLVLWIARRIDLEREIACDDLVIAATGHARSYADCLTRIVEAVDGVSSPWPAATAAEGASQLASRVDAILDKTRRAGAHLMKGRLAAITALLLMLALMATRSPALIAFVTTVAAVAQHTVGVRPLLAQAKPAQPSTPEDLAGQVMEDKSGKPVAAAELRFRKAGLKELAADLETDRQGRFTAPGLPAGQYTIDVVKPNYAGTTFQLTVPSPQVIVRLVHYGVIDGQVNSAAGQPLPAILRAPGGRTIGSSRLTILTKDPASGRLVTFREAGLEDGGHYRVYDLPPGQYAVGFWYSGQNEGAGVQIYPDNTHPRFFPVTSGEEYDHIDFTVVARQSAAVSGRIQLPDGVKGQFQLALGLPDQPNLPLAQTLSEKDGTFQFEKIPPGTYEVFAAGPVGGYGQYDSILQDKGDSYFGRASIQSAGQNIENLSIAVAPAKTLRLLVRARGTGPLPTGCPASVKFQITSLEPWATMFFTNTQAVFGKEQTVPKLAPGLFRIAATDLGEACFQTNEAMADLRGDADDAVIIELVGAGAIHGLMHGGAPGSVVALTSLNPADTAHRRVAYSDAGGHFSFETLPPGRYAIGGKEIEVAGGKATEVEITQ